MGLQMLDLGWLASAAAGSLIILAVGSLAARLCRQPVRRARLIVLTLFGALAVPWLALVPVVPRWSTGILPAPAPLRASGTEHAVTAELPVHQSEIGAGTIQTLEPTKLSSDTRVPWTKTTPAVIPPASSTAVHGSHWSIPASRTLVLASYAGAMTALAAWWLFGQVLLWRVTRAARPVPAAVRDVFLAIAGPAGERVRLLESNDIALPFTYTLACPVILVPTSLTDSAERDALRYVLAHEWSHVERRDSWAWSFTSLAVSILFYQPLFWWLRRQLRLCQDYLADARAAALGSAEDYAAYLVGLARIHRFGPSLPALGIGDRRSNLYRRVTMLVQDRKPLEERCRMAWSITAAVIAVAVVVAASGLRLDAAPPPDDKPAAKEPKPAQDPAKPPGDSKTKGETLHYKGLVKSKETGKPIAAATVVVRRSLLHSGENKVLEESRHTTAADGTYAFVIPPEQASERFLYIELDVEHPDFATRARFGYALSMIRKNERLGERPFFETVELRPAQPITGRIETPEGAPAVGVELLAYSRTDKVSKGQFEYGSFARTKTDPEGKFRLPITTPGQGVYWILPKDFAPELHVLAEGKRGDLGTITVKRGVAVDGVALDVQGKPIAKLLIEARRERGSGPDDEALSRMMVADAIKRTAETDDSGRFVFDPLPPGTYRVMPTTFDSRADRSSGRDRRELPAVFTPKKLTINEGVTPPPLEVRASPFVVIEGRWVDSKGQPKSGWQSSVFGRFDGGFWHDMTEPDAQGSFSLKVPHGLEQVELDISTNEHASARHRIGKDGSLTAGRRVKLDTLDHDVKGLEIVRYDAPIILINATSKDGKQIKGFKATAKYTQFDAGGETQVHLAGGPDTPEAIKDEQGDGRYRTTSLLPDREVEVTATAEGFTTGSRKVTLPEGKSEEITLVLEPSK